MSYSQFLALLLLIITHLPFHTLTQPILPLTPTIAECGPRILPLAACAPFVQGVSSTPTQSCCDSLNHVNNQQPRCLCLLLNNSVFSSSFPINSTLAMQLPLICSVHFDIASCTGSPLPSISPTPQVSLGSTANSTVASSPVTTSIPRSGLIGLGSRRNYAMKLNGSLQMSITMVLAILISLRPQITRRLLPHRLPCGTTNAGNEHLWTYVPGRLSRNHAEDGGGKSTWQHMIGPKT
ncbi:non-specific lipid transfer protein GPI-anchored 10 [Rutidosis leptorrhynchoides]|uniref:non-specific lipid transfer protein GPI-anchored 10 n=1 Tax=Rutidosis leptorrhynchoides TaxID=125765 RepID=UPI003A9960BB